MGRFYTGGNHYTPAGIHTHISCPSCNNVDSFPPLTLNKGDKVEASCDRCGYKWTTEVTEHLMGAIPGALVSDGPSKPKAAMVRCRYCGRLGDASTERCPNGCGAPR